MGIADQFQFLASQVSQRLDFVKACAGASDLISDSLDNNAGPSTGKSSAGAIAMTMSAINSAERYTMLEMNLAIPESEPRSSLTIWEFLNGLRDPSNSSEERIATLFRRNVGPVSFIFAPVDSDESISEIYQHPIIFCLASNKSLCEKIENKIEFVDGDSSTLAKRVRVGGCNFYYGHDAFNKAFPVIRTARYVFQIYLSKYIAKFIQSLSELQEPQKREFLSDLFPYKRIEDLDVDGVCAVLVACTHRFAGPAIEGEYFSYDFATQQLRKLIDDYRGKDTDFLSFIANGINRREYSPSPMLLEILKRGWDAVIEISQASLAESVISLKETQLAEFRAGLSKEQEAEVFTSTLRRLIASYAARLYEFGETPYCISGVNQSNNRAGFSIYFQHLLQSRFPTRPDEASLFLAVLHKELETHLYLNGQFSGTWGKLESDDGDIYIVGPPIRRRATREPWQLANVLE